MTATEAPATGAGLLRRLRRHAGDALFLVTALVVGWFLWPTSLGGCTTLTIVSGHSMEPTYYTGDLVVARCGGYQVGDIVVYNPPDVGEARVIHRIVGGDAAEGWVIQGDNNDFLDPWQPTDERILGRAVLHLPKVGLVGTVLVSPITWVSLLLVAAALVIWPSKPEPEVDAALPDGGASPPTEGDEPDPERDVAPHPADVV
ncbi:signal peptidase I [Actinotalea sp. M2MS4P-6]|uniref:signal peptidase I n=1 Tax=Actinotalea sp. M2MS4P-6 TaxID=2983762 RepID=UPI0021E50A80|nr:signal peptidase I [Actinotalea sp. M2MS4P-6]MCV2395066.1 signal peptidase I [Actinotalea sp. M2MS4P-6]